MAFFIYWDSACDFGPIYHHVVATKSISIFVTFHYIDHRLAQVSDYPQTFIPTLNPAGPADPAGPVRCRTSQVSHGWTVTFSQTVWTYGYHSVNSYFPRRSYFYLHTVINKNRLSHTKKPTLERIVQCIYYFNIPWLYYIYSYILYYTTIVTIKYCYSHSCILLHQSS